MTTQPTSAPLGRLHTQLTDQDTEHLRREIIEGVLASGSRLVERELADRLAVSRVPVREALQQLGDCGSMAASQARPTGPR